MRRIWFYRWGTGSGWLPTFGSDEYGRRTLAIPLGLGAAVVVVLYTCRCSWCDAAREQTAYFEWPDDREGVGE